MTIKANNKEKQYQAKKIEHLINITIYSVSGKIPKEEKTKHYIIIMKITYETAMYFYQ